ncbi:MAG TPA: IS5 family transposase [Microthrixaceae bacterium]|nr:IS5 family transposase [Microthrixaceae bacterium]
MLALHPRTVDALWAAIEPRLPERPLDTHPLGCHRPRRDDRDCFEAILHRLVTGCSWDVAGRLGKGSETTLRRRFNEWVDAGVFEGLVDEALEGYDRIVGLDLSEVAVDGSQHKAPFGGEGTGPNPTDRAKCGWKWSIATDRHGIPVGWEQAGANRNDCILLEPTLDAVDGRGLLAEIETLHLDRGYDNSVARALCVELGLDDVVCATKRKRGTAHKKLPVPLGMRWPVERTNSWLSNYGQLRRNTDRYIHQRLAQFALAVTAIITVKLIKWADRWSPTP